MAVVRHKEAIHSGHFMVSNFELDAQDDIDNIAVPVPEEASNVDTVPDVAVQERVQSQFKSLVSLLNTSAPEGNNVIDFSLTQLFQCMSIAYRQKLTSPKWNRFLGMKLRWKDKIRLNNVIWRCWHMQFIKGHKKLVCAFANPMDLDTHKKTEAGAIMEGKYWKRRLNTITAEYKKWRIFYKNQNHVPIQDHSTDFSYSLGSIIRTGQDDIELESMITDADFFVDALFNSVLSSQGSQSIQGPENKSMKNSVNSDLIQPDLSHLQPHLDDLMDLDPMAPLQDWLSTRLPESVDDSAFFRGKSQTPDQENCVYPMQDIKDIEVMDSSYHPFSHASLRDVTGYKDQVRNNQTSVVMMTRPAQLQAKTEFDQHVPLTDTQPSTSTFSQYSNIPKRKAPLPGKKQYSSWAIQEQLQNQSWDTAEESKSWDMKPWSDQPDEKMKVPQLQPPEADQGSSTFPSQATHSTQVRHRSVIYSNVDQTKHRSVIAMNPMPKSPVPYHPSQNKSPETSFVNFKSINSEKELSEHQRQHVQDHQNHITSERTKHEPLMDRNSELVQLLQTNQRKVTPPSKQKLIQKPMKGQGKESVGRYSYRKEEVAEDLSRSSGNKKILLIPPPPPGSLPQPSFTIGASSTSIKPDETKLSNAEQKRRCTIKNGFEFLRALVPSLSQTPNVKISKAALLTKGAEYVMQLRDERESLGTELEKLRKSVEELNLEISGYQAQLPTAGSAKSASASDPSQLQHLFDKHVATCTMQNWKYWVFSRLMQPLLETYDRTVSSTSMDDLSRTSGSWLDQHASLVHLRPLFLNSLKELSVNTEILFEPHKMPQEALNSVTSISTSLTPKRETNSTQSSHSDGLHFYENQPR